MLETVDNDPPCAGQMVVLTLRSGAVKTRPWFVEYRKGKRDMVDRTDVGGAERLRIIITGHNGFIGSRAMKQLGRKHDVYGYGRKEGGITDYLAIKQFVANIAPDVVIHCAAMGDIGQCEREQDEAYRTNVLGTRNVASACNLSGAWLIHLSSDQVYNPKGGILRESTTVDPQNFYGHTKVWGEEEVRHLIPGHHVLRISWHYGWSESGLPGTRGGILEGFAETLRSGKPVRASTVNRGYVTYVYDLVDVMEDMILGLIPFGTYNIASQHDLTDYERAQHILLAGGIPEEELIDYLVPAVQEQVTYDMRAEPYNLKLLNRPIPSFETGLERCLEGKEELFSER